MTRNSTRVERFALLILEGYSIFSDRCGEVGMLGFESLARLSDLTHAHIGRKTSAMEGRVNRDLRVTRNAARLMTRERLRLRQGKVSAQYFFGIRAACAAVGEPIKLRCFAERIWLGGLAFENDSMLIIGRTASLSAKFAIRRRENFLSRAKSLKTILARPDHRLRPYEVLIWLVTHPGDVEEHLGDFFEMYDRRAQRYGASSAYAWARRQALGIAWHRLKAILGFFSGISAVAHWISRHTGN